MANHQPLFPSDNPFNPPPCCLGTEGSTVQAFIVENQREQNQASRFVTSVLTTTVLLGGKQIQTGMDVGCPSRERAAKSNNGP